MIKQRVTNHSKSMGSNSVSQITADVWDQTLVTKCIECMELNSVSQITASVNDQTACHKSQQIYGIKQRVTNYSGCIRSNISHKMY